MFLKKIVVGPLEANCYIIADENTKDAAIIDPGAESQRINAIISKLGLKPRFVINTHGHADHIGANGSLGLPIYIHRSDEDFLNMPDMNLSGMFGIEISSPPAQRLLEDNDILTLGGLRLEILHTPGHTPGGICVRSGKSLFTGDTLFKESVGRTDVSGGDERMLTESIKEKILALPDDTVIYPGHGPESTIGSERANNPFLQFSGKSR
jgi:glyoxylase-like metal-dependent hydrolase (beta-lactamase superfamily II)